MKVRGRPGSFAHPKVLFGGAPSDHSLENNTMLTRRNMLKGSVLGTLAATAASAHAFTKAPQHWDAEYDIVIVGAGDGGLAAACLALQKGLKTVILEKTAIVGGSSLLCGGKWAVTDTVDQHERGIVDNDELALADMLKTGQYKNDPELVKAYLKETKEHYNFIRLERGIKPTEITHGGGATVARAHNFTPAVLVGDMKKYVEEKGGKILLRTPAERLVWDSEFDGIGGVKAKDRTGKTIYIKAKLGVLLAAGGFVMNRKMLEKFNPLMLKAQSMAGGGCTGDGILMAMAYGADTLDTEYIKATFCYPADLKYEGTTCQAFWSGAIITNKAGKRIVDESISYKLLGDAALKQEDGIGYIVFDEPIRQKRMKAKIKEKKWMELYDKGQEPGCAYRGNTLEEVAKKAGIDPKGLVETVTNYNRNVEAGIKDPEFGRTSINAGSGKLVKIETGPFYIYPATARLIATYCGVKINTRAEVLNVFGEKIPHLYACGEMTGGIHGAAYMTGSSIGKAMAFGRIAVKSMTDQKA
jgi:fumarate reductase flavoprotein subunit